MNPRKFVFRLASAALVVYIGVTVVGIRMDINQKKEREAELLREKEQLILENAELSDVLNSEDADTYVEKIARDKLGYGKPDEKVFVNVSEN